MGSRRVRRVRQEAWPAQELVSKRDRGGGWNSQEKGSRGGQRPGAAAGGRGQREARSDSARRPQLGAPDSSWQQRWPGGQVRHLWPGEGGHPESQIQIQAWHWRFLHGGRRWVSPGGKAPVGGVRGDWDDWVEQPRPPCTGGRQAARGSEVSGSLRGQGEGAFIRFAPRGPLHQLKP